ncbi:MAG TPA: hypothetical protein VFQ00_07920 [Terriglobales bacterium]|nr:hypothetical protein [Terriglobales bacterium]
MNIDERLEKLTERHEALSQTVEILSRDIVNMQGFIKDIAESTARLLHIAQIREHRISKLEGGD